MPAPAALVNLFNQIVEGTNRTWTNFDCYTITLSGGSVLRYTTAPFDVLLNSNLYASSAVRIDDADAKSQAHWKIGLDTDTWQVIFRPRPVNPVTGATFPDTIGGAPWLQAAVAGALDAADFQVDRVYFSAMPTYPISPLGAAPTGSRTIFAGVVASLDVTSAACVITANDYRQLLTLQMPRNLYQGQCRHMLFDVGCQLVASTYAQTGTAQTGSTQGKIFTSLSLPAGASSFALGRIVMTSGLNDGFQRTIRGWNGASLNLFSPLPFAVSVGDSFTLYPGCAKTQAACTAFGNFANYGGQPFIPDPETAA